jgi:AcrR family transcriptional regulator
LKDANPALDRSLRADAARNRERILVAAGQVFAERGLDATLDDVAARAGLGIGTVYRRFGDKAELIEALFEEDVNGVVALAETAAAMEDSWLGLVWFLERLAEKESANLGLRDVILHGVSGQDRLSKAREQIIPLVTHLVERAQRDGRLRPDFVPTDVPMLELMVNSVAAYTNALAPDLWRRYLSILLDGLAVRRADLRPLGPGPTLEVIEATLHTDKRRKI